MGYCRQGPFVKLSDDRYTATILGYVCVLQAEISVIPPLWIAPDRMEAHYVRFPFAGPPPPAPSESQLVNLFERTYVRFGLQKEAVERLLREATVDALDAVLVAEGDKPTSGADGTGRLVYQASNDGSSAASLLTPVRANDLLVEVTPPGQGQPGMDIAGDEIPVTAGEGATLMAGSNVRSEERAGCKLFHAQRDGRVNFRRTC